MLRCNILAGVFLLSMTPAALAVEKPISIRHLSCTVVRYYVAKYSAAAAETWARTRGATDLQIESARKCLGASASQVTRVRQSDS